MRWLAPFTASEHLIVEAGTGVGKSFAYLVPAISLALKSEQKVVISTNTISPTGTTRHERYSFPAACAPARVQCGSGEGTA